MRPLSFHDRAARRAYEFDHNSTSSYFCSVAQLARYDPGVLIGPLSTLSQ